MFRRVYNIPPSQLNLTMYSLGAEEPQPTKKHTKHKRDTHIHKLTHKPKTQPYPIDNKITHKYTTNPTNNQKYTKPKNATNNNITQLCIKRNKGLHSHLFAPQYPKFLLKMDHQHQNNPKYPQLCTKRKKEKKKEKGEELAWSY